MTGEPSEMSDKIVETIEGTLRQTIAHYERLYPGEQPDFVVVIEHGGASTAMHSYAHADHTPNVHGAQVALGVAAVQLQRNFGGEELDRFTFPEPDDESLMEVKQPIESAASPAMAAYMLGAATGKHLIEGERVMRLALQALDAGNAVEPYDLGAVNRAKWILSAALLGGESRLKVLHEADERWGPIGGPIG